MIQVRRDGDEWMAFEDWAAYPESDAGCGDVTTGDDDDPGILEAVNDLKSQRPDLADEPFEVTHRERF